MLNSLTQNILLSNKICSKITITYEQQTSIVLSSHRL